MPRASPERAVGRSALLHAVAGLALASLVSGSAASPRAEPPPRFRAVRSAPPAPLPADEFPQRQAPAAPAGFSASWPFQPTQLNVDLSRGAASVPVLLVPVPVPGPPAACVATTPNRRNGGQQLVHEYEFSSAQPAPVHAAALAPVEPPAPVEPSLPPSASTQTPAPAAVPVSTPRPSAPLPPPLPDSRFPPVTFPPQEDYFAPPPQLHPIFTSEELVREFRAQTPLAPELPPMLLSSSDASDRAPLPIDSAALGASRPQRRENSSDSGARYRGAQRSPEPPGPRTPPPPYHRDSLALMRGWVTVPRADYTEPYTVWFDPASGDSRVDFHGGATSAFRSALPDGRERLTLVWVQRWDGARSRRCATATAAASARPAHPALPDLAGFAYAGVEETEAGRVEVWRRVVASAAGEAGSARGEALTARHELRLQRVDGAARPLRYSVAVDSSALGADCDGYEHVYQYEDASPVPSQFFEVDLDAVCDAVELLDATRPEHLARLQPLREFTQPLRDARYDQLFDQYRSQYARQYADQTEEAVRKNVLLQSSRFAESGNRQGATSRLDTTLLADRLRAEVRHYTGGKGDAAALNVFGAAAAGSRLSREKVREEERLLPSSLDWRRRGAVSPVQNQGLQCSSCWAFAVAGAVEGALFRRTRRLVPLSAQCLVDCAQPFGGNGCKGTWPVHAYNYVMERGLPAQDEYPAYQEKVGQCKEQSSPSQTRISGHVNVTADSVPHLQIAIRRHGPNVVIVDALCQSFVLHKTGVLQDDRCNKVLTKLQHAVLAVGWGEVSGQPHFILKNSWSLRWGDMGYIRVHAHSNTCGVLTMPTHPLLAADDVKQPLRAGARATRRSPARGLHDDDDGLF